MTTIEDLIGMTVEAATTNCMDVVVGTLVSHSYLESVVEEATGEQHVVNPETITVLEDEDAPDLSDLVGTEVVGAVGPTHGTTFTGTLAVASEHEAILITESQDLTAVDPTSVRPASCEPCERSATVVIVATWDESWEGTTAPAARCPACIASLVSTYEASGATVTVIPAPRSEPALTVVEDSADAQARQALAELQLAESAAESAAATVAAKKDAVRALMVDDVLTIDGVEAAVLRPNGFASARFTKAHPEVAAACQTTKVVLDTDAVKAAEPELYESFRSKALTVISAA